MTPATPLHLATFDRVHHNTDPFRYLGCTGCPVDSHTTIWLTVSKDRPIVIILSAVLSFLFRGSIAYGNRNVALNAVVCIRWITLELRPLTTIITTTTTAAVSTTGVSKPLLSFAADTGFPPSYFRGREGGVWRFITQCSRGKTNTFDSMLTDVRTEPIDLPTMADFVKPQYW